jgi:uridine phosphorylase
MAGGAICSEMEAAALYIVAATLRVRAGGIMLILGHHDQSPMTEEELAKGSMDNLLPAAVAGMRELIARDRAAAA